MRKIIREILVLLWKALKLVLWKWLKPILAKGAVYAAVLAGIVVLIVWIATRF